MQMQAYSFVFLSELSLRSGFFVSALGLGSALAFSALPLAAAFVCGFVSAPAWKPSLTCAKGQPQNHSNARHPSLRLSLSSCMEAFFVVPQRSITESQQCPNGQSQNHSNARHPSLSPLPSGVTLHPQATGRGRGLKRKITTICNDRK